MPHRVVYSYSRQISPSVDNTMWYENGVSIPAQLDPVLSDGYKMTIKRIKLTVKTESPSNHWIQPILINTDNVMTDAIDQAVQAYRSLLDTGIAGDFEVYYLGDPKFSKDVPGNNRAGGESLTEVASEGLLFDVEIPQWLVKKIQGQLNQDEPVEEISVAFIGWDQVQIADLNLYYWLQIDYDMQVNSMGISR